MTRSFATGQPLTRDELDVVVMGQLHALEREGQVISGPSLARYSCQAVLGGDGPVTSQEWLEGLHVNSSG